MTFIGIDPGKSGGIAIIREDGSVSVASFDEYEYRTLISCLDSSPSNTVVVVESVHAFSGQGVSSCFNFGKNFGWILGLLFAYDLSPKLVQPQKWKAHYGLIFGKEVTKDKKKSASILKAREIFPDVSLRKTSRCKTDNDGMAEALLMAEYGRRTFSKIPY
jgi:crossover junction endodeoxyribonuclease RuvC